MSPVQPQTLSGIDLSLSRSGRPVLNRVNATVRAGELTAVIGPNGAGKSSLLATMAGLLTPAAGQVNFGEQDLSGLAASERARTLSYLPQQELPAWSLPARDLVALGLLPWGRSLDREQKAERVERALAEVDASALAARPVTQLSGGELRRIQLARLLVGNAPLLIADEPGAALDIRHQIQVMQTFRGQAGLGKTVILALHDLPLAARYCDRILLLQDGRLRAQGSPQEVLSSTLVAEVYGISSEFHWRQGRPEFIAGDLL